MYLGSSGEHDQVIDVMHMEAVARGERPPQKSADNRVMRLIKNLLSTVLVLLVVGGAVWLAGGDPTTVIAAVMLSLGALVVIALVIKRRSPAHVLRPDENK